MPASIADVSSKLIAGSEVALFVCSYSVFFEV
jgi:hypothetical protein